MLFESDRIYNDVFGVLTPPLSLVVFSLLFSSVEALPLGVWTSVKSVGLSNLSALSTGITFLASILLLAWAAISYFTILATLNFEGSAILCCLHFYWKSGIKIISSIVGRLSGFFFSNFSIIPCKVLLMWFGSGGYFSLVIIFSSSKISNGC